MRGKYTIDEIRNIVTPIAWQYGVDSIPILKKECEKLILQNKMNA